MKNKGEMGYLAQFKKRRMMLTLILMLGIVAFVVTGYVTTKSLKNLLTVMGILLSLPLAKTLSGLLVVFPMKSMKEERCCEIMEQLTHIGSDQFLWDLALSSTDTVRHFPIVICSDTQVMAYLKGKKDKTEQEKGKIFFSNLLKNNGHRVELNLFFDEKSFLKAASKGDFSVTSEKEWERVRKTILIYEM